MKQRSKFHRMIRNKLRFSSLVVDIIIVTVVHIVGMLVL